MKTNTLAVPDAFVETALLFPDQVETAIALLDDPKAAEDILGKADALHVYARRIKCDIRVLNAIGYGRLLVIAKLGELLVKHQGKQLPVDDTGGFNSHTIANYRKVAAHREKLPAYQSAIESEEDREMTLAGFLQFVGSGGVLAIKYTGNMEWYTPERYIEAARKAMGSIDLDPAPRTCSTRLPRCSTTPIASRPVSRWSGRLRSVC